jgi:hypothetical protein
MFTTSPANAADDTYSYLISATGLLDPSSSPLPSTHPSLASQLPELLLSTAAGTFAGSTDAASATSMGQVAVLARVALLQEAAKAQEQIEMVMALTQVINNPGQFEHLISYTDSHTNDHADGLMHGVDYHAQQQQAVNAWEPDSTMTWSNQSGDGMPPGAPSQVGGLEAQWFRHLLQRPSGRSISTSSYTGLTSTVDSSAASTGLFPRPRRRMQQDGDGSSGGGAGCGAGPDAVAWTPDSIDPTQSECDIDWHTNAEQLAHL